MNNNNSKYLRVIKITQLTLAKKTETNNLGHETTDLGTSVSSSSSRKQTYMRKFNFVIYGEHKWLSGCAEANAVFRFSYFCLEETQLGQKLECRL